ncbi:MAG TPA: helix-turn-helix domain-containing protein, partial [Clostridia bacterium]
TFADMPDSAREAERAARNAQASRRREVLAFGDIALELFLQEVPSRLKREYRSRVLRGLSETEAADWSRLLSVYFQVDGSLAEAAKLLGIHKNTLQYRLRRLAVLTGHDPRRLRDALALYLTTIMDENRST